MVNARQSTVDTNANHDQEVMQLIQQVIVCPGCNKAKEGCFFSRITAGRTAEKCLTCRRVDAVDDFVKIQGTNGRVSISQQLGHLDAQINVCLKFAKSMANYKVEVQIEHLAEIMDAVMKHDAIGEAVRARPDANIFRNHRDFAMTALGRACLRPKTSCTATSKKSASKANSKAFTSPVASIAPFNISRAIRADIMSLSLAYRRAAKALEDADKLPDSILVELYGKAFTGSYQLSCLKGWATEFSDHVQLLVQGNGDDVENSRDREAATALLGLSHLN